MKERQNYLVAKAFVYFGYNFSNPKEFIHYICEKTGHGKIMEDHLFNKWCGLYDDFGCHAVMNKFFVEINEELREALVEYAIKVYFPNGFPSASDEDKKLLGII